ncbi:MAG: hypothetical protein ABL907_18715, partial [Hyphomicrobium sp.]
MSNSNALTQFFVLGSGPKSYVYADTNILANFAKIGRLDILNSLGRQLRITEEVFREAVTDAYLSGNPAAIANADAINDWFLQAESNGSAVFVSAATDGRSTQFGPDAGERSIAASVDRLQLGSSN